LTIAPNKIPVFVQITSHVNVLWLMTISLNAQFSQPVCYLQIVAYKSS